MPELKVGSIIRTSYDTGPYKVREIKADCTCPRYHDIINAHRRRELPDGSFEWYYVEPPESPPHIHITCIDADAPPKKKYQKNDFSWLGHYHFKDGKWRCLWSDDYIIIEGEDHRALLTFESEDIPEDKDAEQTSLF